jgi:hypothetical protein
VLESPGRKLTSCRFPRTGGELEVVGLKREMLWQRAGKRGENIPTSAMQNAGASCRGCIVCWGEAAWGWNVASDCSCLCGWMYGTYWTPPTSFCRAHLRWIAASSRIMSSVGHQAVAIGNTSRGAKCLLWGNTAAFQNRDSTVQNRSHRPQLLPFLDGATEISVRVAIDSIYACILPSSFSASPGDPCKTIAWLNKVHYAI